MTLIESAGWLIREIPTIKVRIPKAKDQPQFSNWCLLTIEKTVSEMPPNKNDKAKRRDKVSSELPGEVNATTLTMIKNIPTSKGIYQCLMALLIDFKKVGSIILIFNVLI